MRIDHGLNFSQKAQIVRLHNAGESVRNIGARLNVSDRLVQNCIKAKCGTGDSDKYGPLPGSLEWDNLSPGAKSGLTRKRNHDASPTSTTLCD